ncbi:MAG: Fe-S-containing protein, partial [Dehalococcoidia bacterium]|nr:Fe-S-containing protein [Dehalococcoidia bacterium]
MGKENLREPVEDRERKEEVLGKKKNLKLWWAILIIILAAAVPVFWWIAKDGEAGAKKLSGSQVMGKVAYGNTTVAMTSVDAVTRNGVLEIPLEVVKEKKLVSFSYVNKGNQLPLMTYITPKGMLVTAVSMCEPCRSTNFHIEGTNMVCNTCGTRWDLESLNGISGGCLMYPPDVIG